MHSLNIKERFPETWNMLLHAKANGRLSHAYLAVGDDRETLENFAFNWAQTYACQIPAETGEACEKCLVCRKIRDNAYAELYRLQPASKSRQISVDDVRSCEHQLNLATESGKPKICLVFDADRMTVQAQNAFLKTLEEPPRNVILILLSSQPKGLLPTIRSRCQTISLLTNKRTYDPDLAGQIMPAVARLQSGAGSATALEVAKILKDIFTELESKAQEEETGEEESNEMEKELSKSAQKKLDEMRTARIQAEFLRLRERVTEMIQTWFHQKSLLSHGIPRNCLPNPELLEFAGVTADSLISSDPADADKQTDITDEFIECLNDNVAQDLAVEAFCLSLCARLYN